MSGNAHEPFLAAFWRRERRSMERACELRQDGLKQCQGVADRDSDDGRRVCRFRRDRRMWVVPFLSRLFPFAIN